MNERMNTIIQNKQYKENKQYKKILEKYVSKNVKFSGFYKFDPIAFEKHQEELWEQEGIENFKKVLKLLANH